jgi:hypothetical protein
LAKELKEFIKIGILNLSLNEVKLNDIQSNRFYFVTDEMRLNVLGGNIYASPERLLDYLMANNIINDKTKQNVLTKLGMLDLFINDNFNYSEIAKKVDIDGQAEQVIKETNDVDVKSDL